MTNLTSLHSCSLTLTLSTLTLVLLSPFILLTWRSEFILAFKLIYHALFLLWRLLSKFIILYRITGRKELSESWSRMEKGREKNGNLRDKIAGERVWHEFFSQSWYFIIASKTISQPMEYADAWFSHPMVLYTKIKNNSRPSAFHTWHVHSGKLV